MLDENDNTYVVELVAFNQYKVLIFICLKFQLKIKCLGSGIEPVRISFRKPEDSQGKLQWESEFSHLDTRLVQNLDVYCMSTLCTPAKTIVHG